MIHFISNQTRLFEDSAGIELATLEHLKAWTDTKLLEPEPILEVDSETTGFEVKRDSPTSKKMLSLQIGDFDTQFVIDLTSFGSTPQIIKDILEDERFLLLFQNAKFDLRFLFDAGIVPKRVYDCLLAECLLTAGLRETKEDKEKYGLGLDHLAKKYLNQYLDKSIRGNIHREGLTNRVIKYAADDVKYLGQIREKQLVEIAKWELNNVLDLENEVVKVFALMEYNGVYLDADKWSAVAAITNRNTKDLENALDNLVLSSPELRSYVPTFRQASLFDSPGTVARPSITWTSPTQKLKVLNDALAGVAGASKPATAETASSNDSGRKATSLPRVSSTDEKTLNKLKKAHPIVPFLIEYAKQSKLTQSFGYDFLNFQDKATKRVYPQYWQILSTGRVSAKEPNVLQIPSKGELAKAIRAAFVAPPGRKIVGGDYSGMELRIIAEFSQDPLWVKSFQEGLDLHSVLCAQTFGIDLSLVKTPFPPKPDWTYRDIQKTVGFGLAYGMSKYKLSGTAQIELDVADKIITDFFAACPQVEKFLNSIGKLGTDRNYIRTAKPYRRVRFFNPNPNKELVEQCFGSVARASGIRRGEIERASKNMPIQGTNGDVIKLALCNIQRFIDAQQLDIKIMLSVYDEIQTDCPEEIAEWWRGELQRLMVEAAQTIIKTVPVVVDVSINDAWTK